MLITAITPGGTISTVRVGANTLVRTLKETLHRMNPRHPVPHLNALSTSNGRYPHDGRTLSASNIGEGTVLRSRHVTEVHSHASAFGPMCEKGAFAGDMLIELHVPACLFLTDDQIRAFVGFLTEATNATSIGVYMVVLEANAAVPVAEEEVKWLDWIMSGSDLPSASNVVASVLYPCTTQPADRAGVGFCTQCAGCAGAGAAIVDYFLPDFDLQRAASKQTNAILQSNQ